MRVERVETIESELGADRVRLCGHVRYEDRSDPDRIWFDVPADLPLSATGDAWLACLLPLAATIGEPIELPLPVDGRLLAGAREVLSTWRGWYPHLHEVRVEAEAAAADPAAEPISRAAFFSGGVDSFYTALDRRRADGSSRLDALLFVWGLDIALDRREALEAAAGRLRESAAGLGTRLVPIATNLKRSRFREAHWGRLAHGAGLASIALTLQPSFGEVLISSSSGHRDPRPWGSHPKTDPLFGTSRLSIVHYGAERSRTEKMRVVAESETALAALRVCWRSGTDANCGTCHKCCRTIITLELLGALERCSTFPDRAGLDRLDRLYCREPWQARELSDIAELARSRGRPRVARELESAIAGSGRINRTMRPVRLLGRVPGWAGHARSVERRLLAGWVV